ncbi:MAG: hypothetical protein FWF57_02370 [Defluviitaleaceae bacterium]|nr:hypothetical protein [Defluviitaleaceae bacterium]
MSEIILKEVSYRRLKNGQYIVVSYDTSPIVVDEEIVTVLSKPDVSYIEKDEDLFKALKEANFFLNSDNEKYSKTIPKEGNSMLWKFSQYTMIVIGLLSFVSIIISILFLGIPTGDKIIPHNVPILNVIIFIFAFRVIVGLLHELMHMVYGRNLGAKLGGLGFNISKGIAFVKMNHIWVWSFLPRFSALFAGIAFDMFILAILSSLAQIFYNNWMLVTASSVLWVSIIWQLQFYKNCDGHLIAKNILDNPFIHIDAHDKDLKNTKDARVWRRLCIIGYIFSFIIIIFWLIPFLMSIFYYFFDNVTFTFF